MKITEVEAIPLRQATVESIWRDASALIVVRTDEGLEGYGEAAGNPAAIKELIATRQVNRWDTGIGDLVVGEDPTDPSWVSGRYHQIHSFLSGRVGLGHVAFAGVDMAIWDLAGKAQGRPVWQLLSDGAPQRVTPYISIFPHSGPLDEVIDTTRERVREAMHAGFLAVKVECLHDLMPDEADIAPLCRAVRATTGPDFSLILDVGYRWQDADQAAGCLQAVDDVGLRFVEAPLYPDDVEGYARLSEALRTPVGGCEVLTCFSEYVPFMRAAALDVVQGSPNRLGVGDLHRLAAAARERGLDLVPFCYTATAIAYSAGVHVATANSNVPLLEYAPPYIERGGRLRSEIASPDPVLAGDGSFGVPSAPGLGVEIDWDAVERYRVDSR